jgi:hypothetical protein
LGDLVRDGGLFDSLKVWTGLNWLNGEVLRAGLNEAGTELNTFQGSVLLTNFVQAYL